MRRSLNDAVAIELLSNNYIGHFGYLSNFYAHMVPITYFYDIAINTITSYWSKGHKIAAMSQNSLVTLYVDKIISVADWESVLVYGVFVELSGIDAKHMRRAFSVVVKHIYNSFEKNVSNS